MESRSRLPPFHTLSSVWPSNWDKLSNDKLKEACSSLLDNPGEDLQRLKAQIFVVLHLVNSEEGTKYSRAVSLLLDSGLLQRVSLLS